MSRSDGELPRSSMQLETTGGWRVLGCRAVPPGLRLTEKLTVSSPTFILGFIFPPHKHPQRVGEMSVGGGVDR